MLKIQKQTMIIKNNQLAEILSKKKPQAQKIMIKLNKKYISSNISTQEKKSSQWLYMDWKKKAKQRRRTSRLFHKKLK